MGIERIVTQFKRVVETSRTAADLINATADVTQWLGFRFFAITHHVDLAASPNPICLTNYPSPWVNYYQRNAYGLVDPVHRASHMTPAGFWWSNMAELIRLNDRDDTIMRLGRIQGIGEGFTIPTNLAGGLHCSCTFSAESGFMIDSVKQGLAQLAGLMIFAAAHRLWPGRNAMPAELRPKLTPQQLACVQLVARGLNDRQIGEILGLAEETVASHIKNACERYGVKKRTSLVAFALLDGAIMVSKL
ncbi:helix-turn-helix transcriptional regulator [Novosphingobium terrae]|uniref:helix-turn-helix transcriptional regulator n=1 Tax=Novosphingobium terrae TaxID=2726189 RepID=UPI0019812C90|nr:LuxR family transcriptional regulator [Novosphingobium terrae]